MSLSAAGRRASGPPASWTIWPSASAAPGTSPYRRKFKVTVLAISLHALIFIGLVLACFATLIIAVAGDHIDTRLSARRVKVRTAPRRDSSSASGDHAAGARISPTSRGVPMSRSPVGSWIGSPIDVIRDRSPAIRWTAGPDTTRRGLTEIVLGEADDEACLAKAARIGEAEVPTCSWWPV